MKGDDVIEQARRILDGRTTESHTEYESRPWAEALLAEHAARALAERERDRMRGSWGAQIDELSARVATLEAALIVARYWVDDAWRGADFGGFLHRAERAKHDLSVIDAALEEQDTPADIRFSHDEDCSKRSRSCPTCGSDDPARQQGLAHTDLHAQVRCRDPWHSALPVEENPL